MCFPPPPQMTHASREGSLQMFYIFVSLEPGTTSSIFQNEVIEVHFLKFQKMSLRC